METLESNEKAYDYVDTTDLINLSTVSINKKYIEYGEEFVVKINIRNRSELDIFNVSIKGCVLRGTRFEGTGVKINGVHEKGNHPLLGINIIRIEKGLDVEIEYVLKGSLKDGGEIEGILNIDYQYYDFKKDGYITLRKNLTLDKVKINGVNFFNEGLIFKGSDLYSDVNEEIVITLKLFNSGNISANNCIIHIDLPREIRRLGEDVYLNGETLKLNKGLREINVGKIDSLEGFEIKLKCEAIDRSINKNSLVFGKITYESFVIPGVLRKKEIDLKSIAFNISSPDLKLKPKFSNKEPIINEIVDFSLDIKNVGNKDALNCRAFLSIPGNLKLIDGKITVDGEILRGEELLNGLKVGNIYKNREKRIEGKFLCIDGDREDYFEGKLSYEYEREENFSYKESHLRKEIIKISKAECTIDLLGDKEKILLDEVIEFTAIVKNTGDLKALNTYIKCKEIEQIKFQKGSIKIGDKAFELGNISRGICIGDLDVNEEVRVFFKGKVIKVCTGKDIELCAEGKFQYRNKKFLVQEKEIQEKRLLLKSICSLFKNLSIESLVKISPKMPEIKEILDLKLEVFIKEHYPIDTYVGEAYDRGRITGKKLVVNGVLEATIEYISNEADERIFLVKNEEIFSTFIILPAEFKVGERINILAESKDGYTRIKDRKSIYVLSTINIEGRIVN